MKKTLLFLLVMPITYFSQVAVVEEPIHYRIGSVGEINITEFPTKKDTSYVFAFRNEKYTTLTDFKYFSFGSGKKGLDDLYNALISIYSEENKDKEKYSFTIKIDNSEIYVSKWSMGKVYIMFEEGYCTLSKRGLDKLFNKKKIITIKTL